MKRQQENEEKNNRRNKLEKKSLTKKIENVLYKYKKKK